MTADKTTLYIGEQDHLLRCVNNNIQLFNEAGEKIAQAPLSVIEGVVLFGRVGITQGLVHAFAKEGLELCWMSANGRFVTRLDHGQRKGGLALLLAQVRAHDDAERSLELARLFIAAKLRNQMHLLRRSLRKDGLGEAEKSALQAALAVVTAEHKALPLAKSVAELMGREGVAASAYWSVFSLQMRKNQDFFHLKARVAPRATDPTNALLNFLYTLLHNDVAGACRAMGLNPGIGFLHAVQPGRTRESLACDLVEELRPWLVDRLVLRLINLGQITPDDFASELDGPMHLKQDSIKALLKARGQFLQEKVAHPALAEPVELRRLPHLQAKFLRENLVGDKPYMPFVVLK